MESVTYRGKHRRRSIVAEWTPTGEPVFRWRVAITIDGAEPITRRLACPPSWEAVKRHADELTGDDEPKTHRKTKSLPDLRVVG